MSNNPKTIHNLLSDWGRKQRQVPENNLTLKSEIINRLPIAPTTIPRSALRLPWLSFALTGMAIFIFAVSLPRQNKINLPIATPQNNISTPGNPAPMTSGGGAAPQNTYQSQRPAGSALNSPPQDSIASPQRSAPALNENSKAMNPAQGITNEPIYPPVFVSPPPQNTEIPSTDTREYLKTDYSADIKTRNVQELDSRLQTTIRGFNGRVDANNSTPDFGSISFVIPADQLSSFKEEVKSVAGAKFYTEQTSSENLLPQKKDIEQQQTDNNNVLAQLTSSRDQLTQTHNQTVASLNRQISADKNQLSALQNEIPANLGRAMEINQQEQDLQSQIKNLQAKLVNENANYANQLQSLNWQIQDAQNTQTQLNQQTSDLLDTVATVRGTISLTYISFWQMINTYFALYWIGLILLALAAAAFFFPRRSWRMDIP